MLDDLGEQIAELAIHLDAATHTLLTHIRAFDQGGGWSRQGAKSCAHWLSWRIHLQLGPAREYVRVANTLGELPLIDEAFRTGRLSYSKARAITRAARPETQEALLELARITTGAQLEIAVRKYRGVQRHDPKDEPEHRYVRRRDRDDGMVHLDIALREDEAALVMSLLDKLAAREVAATADEIEKRFGLPVDNVQRGQAFGERDLGLCCTRRDDNVRAYGQRGYVLERWSIDPVERRWSVALEAVPGDLAVNKHHVVSHGPNHRLVLALDSGVIAERGPGCDACAVGAERFAVVEDQTVRWDDGTKVDLDPRMMPDKLAVTPMGQLIAVERARRRIWQWTGQWTFVELERPVLKVRVDPSSESLFVLHGVEGVTRLTSDGGCTHREGVVAHDAVALPDGGGLVCVAQLLYSGVVVQVSFDEPPLAPAHDAAIDVLAWTAAGLVSASWRDGRIRRPDERDRCSGCDRIRATSHTSTVFALRGCAFRRHSSQHGLESYQTWRPPFATLQRASASGAHAAPACAIEPA